MKGLMTPEHIADFLTCFYRNRPQGPTQSGGYVLTYPPGEFDFIAGLFEGLGRNSLDFFELLAALERAQAERHLEPPLRLFSK